MIIDQSDEALDLAVLGELDEAGDVSHPVVMPELLSLTSQTGVF